MSLVEVPIFPLNTVLFPGGLLPLRVFEPRYVRMVRDCTTLDIGFAVMLIRDGQEAGEPANFHDLGTLARIVDFSQLPDGLLGVTAHGERRIRVRAQTVAGDGLISGQIELIADDPSIPLAEDYRGAADLLQALMEQLPEPFRYPEADMNDATWVSGRLAELLPISLALKHRLLTLDDPGQRMDVVYALLQEQNLV